MKIEDKASIEKNNMKVISLFEPRILCDAYVVIKKKLIFNLLIIYILYMIVM